MFSGLYVIIDMKLVRGDICTVAENIIAGGARFIQLRAKAISTREFITAGTLVGRICNQNKIPFIINDRVDIALALNADGVHVGQNDMPLATVRNIMNRQKLIGLSVHSLEEARKARVEKPDYIGVGPVFFTTTKPIPIPPVGVGLIRKINKQVDLPIIAIGGISEENIAEVIKTGADTVAVCSAILGAPDIKGATERLVSEYNKAQGKRGHM